MRWRRKASRVFGVPPSGGCACANPVSVCEWVRIYFLWRPNLPDEADNHLIELALAGGADIIVTHNVRDVRRGELSFPQLQILTPREFLKTI